MYIYYLRIYITLKLIKCHIWYINKKGNKIREWPRENINGESDIEDESMSLLGFSYLLRRVTFPQSSLILSWQFICCPVRLLPCIISNNFL